MTRLALAMMFLVFSGITYAEEYELVVEANPVESRIRVMNIVPKYYPGIKLSQGKYDINVTKPGYKSCRNWIKIDKDTTLNVNLVEESSGDNSECFTMPSDGNIRWKLYPDPRTTLVRENEKILFELFLPTQDDFILELGDGKQVPIPISNFSDDKSVSTSSLEENLEIDCSSSKCVAFYEHTYLKSGAYKASVGYKDKPLQKTKRKILIVNKDALTNEELKEKAKEAMFKELVSGLKNFQAVRPCGKDDTCNSKLAIAVLHDANFDHNEEPMVRNVTKKLVEEGYWVVERHPHALIKLIFESVVDTSDIKKQGDTKEKYLDTLEYTLVPSYNNIKQPFVYDAKIESGNQKLVEEITQQILANQADEKNKDEKKTKRNISRLRSSLFSRIDTAQYLLVLDTKNIKEVESPPKEYYSTHYKSLIQKRKFSMEMNVRLLRRGGSIIWMKDVKGEFEDNADTIMPTLH